MFTLIVFLIVISVLVFVHEAGHFVMAKRAGMRVDEFGLGFPPRLWSITRGETRYSVNLIPFGGFVRIFGEDGSERREPRSFGAAPFWRRVTVVVAGVIMNFLFAAVLLMLVNFLGLRVGIFEPSVKAVATDVKVQVVQVSPDSPAATAELRSLDEIVGFRLSDGSLLKVSDPEAVQEFSYANAGRTVTMVISRGDGNVEVPIELRQPIGPTEGPIGVSLVQTGVVRYPWYHAIWRGLADAALMVVAIVVGFGKLFASIFTGGTLVAQVSGPVGIAALTGQAARIGVNYLIQFTAVISLHLAVLNILPFPALDGGRLVLLIAERIRGRALRVKTERLINGIGFLVLIVLLLAVTARDIGRFF
jgi:regulator of sigma E protease